MSPITPFPIAIMGAGPAGLLLGRLLHLSAIPFTIYESDESSSSRGQGGTLDLHTDTGLAAIKKAGLWTSFTQHARYDGEAFTIVDDQFTVFFQKAGSTDESNSGGRPEIDRRKLRQILLESVPTEHIRWGKKLREVVSIEDREKETFELHFVDGTTASGFSLVVGADGAWSKVRALLTDDKPSYTGVGGITLRIADAATRAPDLHALVNRGSFFGWSFGRGIAAQQIGDGSLYVITWGALPEDWMSDRRMAEGGKLDIEADPVARTAFLDGYYAGWAPELRAFYRRADPDVTEARNIYMVPVSWRWTHRQGVTLIGDAAHLMSPFAGEGVNVALTDAMHLAEAIAAAFAEDHQSTSPKATNKNVLTSLDTHLRAFEDEMYERSRKVRALTKANMDDFMTPAPMAEWIGRFGARMQGMVGTGGKGDEMAKMEGMPAQIGAPSQFEEAIERSKAKRRTVSAGVGC